MNNIKKPRKSIFIYYSFLVILVLLFNSFVMPLIFNNTMKEVDYGTFLRQVEAGKVEKVEINQTQIGFTLIDSLNDNQIYFTGRIEDSNLVERLYDANVTFNQVIPEENSPIIDFLIGWLFPSILIFTLGQLFFKRIFSKLPNQSNAMSFGKSNAKIYVEAQTGKSFKDVAGQDEAKEALIEIVDYLSNPKKYSEIGAKVPKGVLLVGAPGTGKTLLAKALAGEAKVPFFSISGSEFIEMFVGLGAARVRDLFKQAQEKAPCIIFIDEIDAIGKSRNTNQMGGNDEREQTLNQLLTEMDGFNADKGVVILAATNRPEVLDKALLRPGRFDRRVICDLPDINGRKAILEVHLNKVKTNSFIDLDIIAHATSGASGADLANIINEAALRAVRNSRNTVTQLDLEESVENILAGAQRKNTVISPKDKSIIAYHEIGHALVAAKLQYASSVHKISIIPRTSGALGYTLQIDESDQVLFSKEQLIDKITVYLGGRAAEEIVFNSITTGASNDIEQATKLARAMVTRFGMTDTFDMMGMSTLTNIYLNDETSLNVSSEFAYQIDNSILKIIKECHQKALSILNENITLLHSLTKILFVQETLSKEEFEKLVLEG